MELANKFISNDQTVGSNTKQDQKEFKSKSLATRAKKRRMLGFHDASY